jgi:hypothetical protein
MTALITSLGMTSFVVALDRTILRSTRQRLSLRSTQLPGDAALLPKRRAGFGGRQERTEERASGREYVVWHAATPASCLQNVEKDLETIERHAALIYLRLPIERVGPSPILFDQSALP